MNPPPVRLDRMEAFDTGAEDTGLNSGLGTGLDTGLDTAPHIDSWIGQRPGYDVWYVDL